MSPSASSVLASAPLRYISLGAGVQSSALLVISALGLYDCPKADVAIFADTWWEPRYVYEALDRLKAFGAVHGIPVVTVTAGDLGAKAFAKSGGGIPAYTLNVRARTLKKRKGMLRRKCTVDFKIRPIQREVKRRLGGAKGVRSGRRAEALIGISRDEATRMKPAMVPWITNRYPLVDAEIRRLDCIRIVTDAGLPEPQKSSCKFCPFSSDSRWLDLKRHHPREWEEAVRFDEAIRNRPQCGIKFPSYLHEARIPLSQVELRHERQQTMDWGFQNECEGHCGV